MIFSTWKPNSPMSLLRRDEITVGDAPAEVGEVLQLCAVARDLSGGCFDPWGLPGGLDPTGLVKGWAADRALADLRAAGVRAAIVSGRRPRHLRRPRARIAVEDSVAIRGPKALSCIVASPGAVATSGCYERGQHVIDPATGRPGTRSRRRPSPGPSSGWRTRSLPAFSWPAKPAWRRSRPSRATKAA